MIVKSVLAATATALLSFGAEAAVLYTDLPVSPVQTVPGSLSANFAAGAGAGSVSFDINGYLTLDGVNCCTDTFTLALNGTDIFSGSFGLGGGGSNVIFFGPGAATLNITGTTASIFVPLTLLAGANTLGFNYTGAFQGLADEGWTLSNVIVNGNAPAVGGVPEPANWAMLIAGFGLVGAVARRQRAVVAA